MDDEPFEEGIAFLDVPVDRGGDAPPLLIRFSTDDDLPRGFLHQALETLEVTRGDDASVRVGRKSVTEVELPGRLFDRLHKGILSRARDKDVVGSYTNLRRRRFVQSPNAITAPRGAAPSIGFSVEVLTWPAFRHLPQRTRFAAILRSVVLGSMTTGDFPPNSRVMGVRCSAAAFATTRATVPFPVYVTGFAKPRTNDEHAKLCPVEGPSPDSDGTHCDPISA